MSAETSVRTRLRRSPGALRLTVVKFAGQFGDGMFQAALGGAILFNPERETDPIAIAAGFAVLLLPYSLVGPFAGALLDRWDRRSVLLWANLLRGILIGVAAVLLATGGGDTPLLVTALAAVGVSRFVLAGVSASLPNVVRASWLVPMNSVLATVGSGVSAAGAGVAVAVIGIVGSGDAAGAVATGLSIIGSVIGIAAAAGFRAGVLGRGGDGNTSAVGDVLRGFASAAASVWRAQSVLAAMFGIGAHRIVFGIDTLVMVLLLRENTSDGVVPAGFAGFGVALTATAAGMLLAALLTPVLIPRIGRRRTIAGGLFTAALVQGLLIATLTPDVIVVGAFFLGVAGQTIKLTGDAAMQLDVDDAHRGRVFSLQDTVFNVAFVGAIAVSAVFVDHTQVLVYAGAVVYALALLLGAAARPPRQ
ncbi:MFS transporter [Rhodococcoides trifolii]|uniref:MFS transporter n=1 Tax=Rhodococcoides trifolii TaxID=908250 RepID=A0A917CLA8_9NOCA|nr:MFS transporter [Rhodococcus trifolii]GGF91473.1 MFS transporter [Rhodococcus trifolii]